MLKYPNLYEHTDSVLGNQQVVFLQRNISINVIHALVMSVGKVQQSRLLQKSTASMQLSKNKLAELVPYGPQFSTPLAYPSQPLEYPQPVLIETEEDKTKRIKRELIEAGITAYGLLKSESRILHKVLHPMEHVEAIVYGQHHSNSVMLAATNERVIFLDKKPMALYLDEVSYEVVSGLEYAIHTFFASLVLHTPVKNYDIRFANLRCAERFAKHIENHRLKRDTPAQEMPVNNTVTQGPVTMHLRPRKIEGMSGYYWLPIEDEKTS